MRSKSILVLAVVVFLGMTTEISATLSGEIVAWGRNTYGQTDVPTGNDFVDIAAGHYHSVALKNNGSITTWGEILPPPVVTILSALLPVTTTTLL